MYPQISLLFSSFVSLSLSLSLFSLIGFLNEYDCEWHVPISYSLRVTEKGQDGKERDKSQKRGGKNQMRRREREKERDPCLVWLS